MKLFRSTDAWQSWFINFQRSFLILLAPWLVSVLAQGAGRAYLLAAYAPPAPTRRCRRTSNACWRPACCLTSRSRRSRSRCRCWPRWCWPRGRRRTPCGCAACQLGAVLATLFAASTVVSVYYFATFSRSIDIFVFGLMDDDTRAILATLWHGYPVLRTLALLAAVLGATYWLARRWGSGIMRARLARRAGSQRAAAVPDHRRHGAGLSRLAGHLSAQQGRHRHLVAAPAQRHHAQRHFGVLLGVVRARQRQALQPRHR
ncbi:hypothetical protein WJ978_09345 [Achromobacter xylosoxidans]